MYFKHIDQLELDTNTFETHLVLTDTWCIPCHHL